VWWRRRGDRTCCPWSVVTLALHLPVSNFDRLRSNTLVQEEVVSTGKKLPTLENRGIKRLRGDGREGADTLEMVDNSCRVFEGVDRDVARTLEFFRLKGYVATEA
jgi:hypothetical protein